MGYDPVVDGTNLTFDSSLVKRSIRSDDELAYYAAADYLNQNGFTLVILMHEFGIFRGDGFGAFVLCLLNAVKAPVVTTMHTVKPFMHWEEHAILQQLVFYSRRVVVMTETMRRYLDAYHGIPPFTVSIIPHGVPDVPLVDMATARRAFPEWGARPVFLTFGLLHPGKGCEFMIRAMPAILERFPDALYLVLGQPHPKGGKETLDYFQGLQKLVESLALQKSVRFNGEYVPSPKLLTYLAASTVYVTPYLDMDQAVSGTVAMALSVGSVVVSTPYLYSKEVLRGVGRIVPTGDSAALSETLLALLENPAELARLRERAYAVSRSMRWATVGEQYLREEYVCRP
jgi:glycosyltransferase involved in cell wall biosynthesis